MQIQNKFIDMLGLKTDFTINETEQMTNKNKRKAAESRSEVKTYGTDFK
jgi:hypothetical protein